MKKYTNNGTVELKRNFFLTILLILVIAANAYVGVINLLVIMGVVDGSTADIPRRTLIVNFLVGLGNMVCGFAMWNWRKWGLIGYGAIVLTAYTVTGIVTKDFSDFYALVGLALLTILFYPFWKYMK